MARQAVVKGLHPCRFILCTFLSVALSAAGAYQGLRNGFVLYGTEGTLQLDLTTKKLTLGLKEEGERLPIRIEANPLTCHAPN